MGRSEKFQSPGGTVDFPVCANCEKFEEATVWGLVITLLTTGTTWAIATQRRSGGCYVVYCTQCTFSMLRGGGWWKVDWNIGEALVLIGRAGKIRTVLF